jgi:hypothetical protein
MAIEDLEKALNLSTFNFLMSLAIYSQQKQT